MLFDKKKYKNVWDFYKQCNFSENNYDSTEQPFCMKNIKFNTIEEYENYNMNNSTIDNFEKKHKIPDFITVLYKLVNNDNTEFYYKDIIFMSYNKIKEVYEDYAKNNQYNVFDFCYVYHGMGHLLVFSVDLLSSKIFIRMDGGSNGYDREYNYKNILKYNTKNNVDKFLTLSQFLKYIEHPYECASYCIKY
tara:strand:+ start:2759 stop:3331 length:573 start_codon:yes stop_codon:yes gene_type:complete